MSLQDRKECARREIFCSPTSCAKAQLGVIREAELVARQAQLHLMADCLEGSWHGLLSASLRDHADLLEVAHRNRWWDR